MILEVGKEYINRVGKIVKIKTYRGEGLIYPFLGYDGESYTKEGEYYRDNISPFDLIKPYQKKVTLYL